MRELVPSTSEPGAGRSLNPNRISIWPVERGGYGIDFTYYGATGYTDAETAAESRRPVRDIRPCGKYAKLLAVRGV
jgi:hypothetical protein